MRDEWTGGHAGPGRSWDVAVRFCDFTDVDLRKP